MSSLMIIEEFYGSQLSTELLHTIQNTPLDQLIELEKRLRRYSDRVAEVLDVRWGRRSADAARQTLRVLGISPRYDYFLSNGVFLHDRLFTTGGTGRAVTEVDELKHLLLYCDRPVIPDPVLAWIPSLDDDASPPSGVRLTRAIRQILPLAPLMRSGDVLAIPPPSHLYIGDWPVPSESAWETYSFYLDDPYVAWTVVNDLGLLEPSELPQYGSDPGELEEAARLALHRTETDLRPDGPDFERLIRALMPKLWPRSSLDEIDDIVAFSHTARWAALIPIGSDPRTLHHIEAGGRILLEGGVEDGSAESSIFGPAIQYRIPRLSHVALEDIVALRQNEELFQDLREGLTRVAEEAAGADASNGYEAYSQVVRSLAGDLIEPIHTRLERDRKRANRRNTIWGRALAGMVSLGVKGIGTLLGFPPPIPSKLGTSAGTLARSKVTKRSASRRRDLEVAGSILYSLLD